MAKGRIAGEIFKGAKKVLGQGNKLLGLDQMGTVEKAARFGPDALFATMNAINNPGDLGDKLIAGTTDFVGSAGTGLVLAAPFKRMPVAAGFIDQAGSIAGMYGGMAVGDSLQRGKDRMMGGEGRTSYERASTEYEDQLVAQILKDLDTAGLLTPAGRSMLTNDNTGAM